MWQTASPTGGFFVAKNMQEGNIIYQENLYLNPEHTAFVGRQTPERMAWKKALEIYPLIKAAGEAVDNPNQLYEKVISSRVLRDMPIPFAGFWGIGDKKEIDASDIHMIDHLRKLSGVLREKYEHGARVTSIFADEHGVFNGFGAKDDIRNSIYIHQVKYELNLAGIGSFIWLSELYKIWDLRLPDIADVVDETSEAYQSLKKNYDAHIKSASMHNKIEGITPTQAAYHYVNMRLREKAMLREAFPETILFVNGGKRLAAYLMPKDMPILYLKEGPVWFKK